MWGNKHISTQGSVIIAVNFKQIRQSGHETAPHCLRSHKGARVSPCVWLPVRVQNMLLQNKSNKICHSLGVQGESLPLSPLKKMEDDKEKPEKEINLLLCCVRWNWILTKIMLLKENLCAPRPLCSGYCGADYQEAFSHHITKWLCWYYSHALFKKLKHISRHVV